MIPCQCYIADCQAASVFDSCVYTSAMHAFLSSFLSCFAHTLDLSISWLQVSLALSSFWHHGLHMCTSSELNVCNAYNHDNHVFHVHAHCFQPGQYRHTDAHTDTWLNTLPPNDQLSGLLTLAPNRGRESVLQYSLYSCVVMYSLWYGKRSSIVTQGYRE